MGSVRHSAAKDEGSSPAMRRVGGGGESSREGARSTATTVGMLSQIKNNREISRRRMENSGKTDQAQHNRKRRNSFRAFRRSGSGNRFYFVCILSSLLIGGMLVGGVIVGVKYSAPGGWSLFAFGLLLAICAVVVIFVLRKRSEERKKQEEDFTTVAFCRTDISEFPYDPVLQRGITHLVYHGQSDCQLCTLLRESERCYELSSYDNDHCARKSDYWPKNAAENTRKIHDRRCDQQLYKESGHTGLAANQRYSSHERRIRAEACSRSREMAGIRETSFITLPDDQAKPAVEYCDRDASNDENYNHNNREPRGNSPNSYKNRQSLHEGMGSCPFEGSQTEKTGVLTRDSILTTKKRTRLRNKEWKSRASKTATLERDSNSSSSASEKIQKKTSNQSLYEPCAIPREYITTKAKRQHSSIT